MKRYLFMFALAAVASAQSLTWIPRTPPSTLRDNSWNALDWDHVNRKFLLWGQSGDYTSVGIYSTEWWSLDAGALWNNTAAWTHLYGTGKTNPCDVSIQNTPFTPAPSHPYRHAAMDTTRDLYWMTNGARSQCGGVGAQRWGYKNLHDPTHTWTWLPAPQTSSLIFFQAQLIYFQNYDMFVLFGPDTGSYWAQQMYCPTVPVGGGSPTGVVSAKQATVGCTNANADKWITITTAANPSNPHGNNPGSQFCGDPRGCVQFGPAGVYMPATGTAFALGGWSNSGPTYSNVAWELRWNGTAWQWNELCQAAGCSAPPGATNYPPIALDTKRNLVYYHWTDGTNTADYYYSRTLDQWVPAGTGGGSKDPQINLGYDPVNDKVVSESNAGYSAAATYVADPSVLGGGTGLGPGVAPTLSSVTCNPTSLSGASSSNCIVSLSAAATSTTVVALSSSSAAVSVPKTVTIAAGSATVPFTSMSDGSLTASVTVTATLAGISRTLTLTVATANSGGPGSGATRGVGKGCGTAYFIDNDCDGRGVAVRADGNYTTTGKVGDTPDADDNDPAVSSVASWRSKYGIGPTDDSEATLRAFLQASRGYNPPSSHIWYISSAGNDNDCTTNGGGKQITHPCLTTQPFDRTYNDGAGGLVLWRGGTYSSYNSGLSGYATRPHATSPDSPLILMAYPGEAVYLNNNYMLNTDVSTATPPSARTLTNVIVEGFAWTSPGDCVSQNFTNGWIFRRNEFSSCADTGIRQNNHIQNMRIEWNVFHDSGAHAIYFGNSSGNGIPHSVGVDFDFTQDAINFAAGTSDGAGSNITIRNNISYRDGHDGYESFHINSYLTNVTIDSNIIHSSTTGSTVIGLQTGVYNSTIQNNLLFNNRGSGISVSLYGGDVQAATHRYNKIINNTMWVGFNDPSARFATAFVQMTDNTANGAYVTVTNGSTAIVATGGWFSSSWASGRAFTLAGVTYHVAAVTDQTHLTMQEPYAGASGSGVGFDMPTRDGDHYMKDFTIRNNVIVTANQNSGGTSIDQPFWFLRSSYPATHTITNNLFWASTSAWDNSTYPVMTLVANSTPGAAPTGTGGGEVRYNLAQFQAYYPGGSTNIASDPLLVSANPANNSNPLLFDFHLGSGSPAINLGATIGSPSVDLQGNTRSGPPDAGAYEYTAASSVGPSLDLNGDGVINILDVQIAINQALGVAVCKTGDANGDGQCTAADVQIIISKVIAQ